MPQLWQGRASKAVDSRVNDFNSSIRFDARMIEQDIQGSLVHSAMLGRQGIISQQDVDDIHKGLHSILEDLHSGALEIDPNAEDVHTFVEQTLTARVGDAGKRLKPMGKVCSSVGDSPVLHRSCHNVRNLDIEPRALVNRLFKRAVDICGKVRLHNSVVENHAAEDF